MFDQTLTISFSVHLWWLWAYLAAGVVTFLPLNWWAWRQIHCPGPFWYETRRAITCRPKSCLIQTLAWPVCVYETIPRRKK